MATQRRDGLYGSFIVHQRVPQLPYFTLMIGDWTRADARTHSVTNPFSINILKSGTGELFADPLRRDTSVDGVETSSYIYDSAVINGRGRSGGRKYPLAHFLFGTNVNHRFHLINVGGEFTYELSIDKHSLRVVAIDGKNIELIVVDSVMVHPGETIDFELEPIHWNLSKVDATYWIRGRTLRAGFGPDVLRDGVLREVRAVLIYAGASPLKDPTSSKRICSFRNPCNVFNCPFAGYPINYYKHCMFA